MAIAHTCMKCGRGFNRHVRVARPVCGRCQMEAQREWMERSGASEASTLVNRAVKRGELAAPQGLKCVDCGLTASRYDHRDYNKPLAVEPVCASCNNLRGPAIWRSSSELAGA